MDYKDYYATLGIPTDADEQAIKTAFRRLARVHHPDVAIEKQGATERFKEINEAYTVLSDPEKRRTYDQFRSRYERYQANYREPRTTSSGAAGSRPNPAAAGQAREASRDAAQASSRPGPRGPRTRSVNEEDFERLFRGFMWAYTAAAAQNSQRSGSTASSDFSDFFEALFGNLRNSPGAGRPAPAESTVVRPGRDIQVSAKLTLEEAFHGATRTLTYADGRKVEVSIPAGIHSGARLRVRGHGERLMNRPLGDLYMTIEVQPHPVFARDGNDLRIRVSVPHELATKSGDVQIPTMDRSVQMRIPSGTQSGQLLRLRGQGMPTLANPAVRGDLIAEIQVQAPDDATYRANGASSAGPSSQGRAQPGADARKSTVDGGQARTTSRVRQALGLAITALSLLGLTATALIAPSNGWLLATTLAGILLAYGVAGRSLWASGLGLLVAAGAVWLLTQADLMAADALRQVWPVLPAALGVGLLSAGRKADPP